jgi:hypothetical protein
MNDIRVINAQQARIIHHYKSTKEKLFKTNAVIWNCAFVGVNRVLMHKLCCNIAKGILKSVDCTA